MDGPMRDHVLKLIDERSKLENELVVQLEILKTNNVDMTTPLVDDEGYPRQDIDVYQVRHARHKIICLQNDLKASFRQIKKGLDDVYTECAATNPTSHTTTNIATNISPNHADAVPLKPFAVVTMVDNGSPADIAVSYKKIT